jgi:EAL domain-containing protein (putative c-di-GMP-specific phosphodiesterase class I)/CheY-like chemotaxis protein
MDPQSTPALRVLAIDDEPFQLKLLTKQLAGLGIDEVRTCLEASVALAQLQADPACADLVCCDLQMPEMDGIEFLRHLGQTGYRGGLVLISGEDRGILKAAERLSASYSLRLCGAFHKPVRPEQLRQALAAVPRPLQSMPGTNGLDNGPQSGAPGGAARARRMYGADELARAMARGELVNHYQPKVEFATGRWVGVETLLRWQHPQDGMVFPDQFIGAAEENSGLIDELTRLVLFGPRGALPQARTWQDAGLALQVAVNVSMENLKDWSFPDIVAREARTAGIAPSQLIIEVTETRMMQDPPLALDILTRLRLKRVGVSIDDFGTGHSSLAQLLELPFDELKLDRQFVHGACRDATLRAVLLPCLQMAQQLGIATVAEGVEDADDWHFLRQQGCLLAQGYFIARPMSPQALAAWAADWEARHASLAAAPATGLGDAVPSEA